MEDVVVDDHVFRPTDEASIVLLRGLRTNTTLVDDHSFIHHADVCSAAPEELVSGLQPVPGTDEAEDGYHSVWYFYCPKRYKNTQGKLGGHRQRAVGPEGDRTCWHSETGKTKPVHGVPGATFCNLSFVRKDVQEASGRVEKVRLGWCMTEFDDAHGGGGDHVLCKVHRASSSLAKKRSKSSSASASRSKRKAAGDDHPEAPPTKLIHDKQVQVQVQLDAAAFSNDYPVPCYYEYDYEQEQVQVQVQQNPAALPLSNDYPVPYYDEPHPQDVDPEMVVIGGEEEDHGVQQQPRDEPEHGQLIHDEQVMQVQQNPDALFSDDAYPTMPYGQSPQGMQQQTRDGPEHGQLIHDEQMQVQAQQNPGAVFSDAYPTMPCYVHSPQGVDPETMFGGEEQEEEHGVQHQQQQQQACVESSEAEHSGDSGEFNVDDLLKMEEFNNDEYWSGLLQMLRGEEGGQEQQILEGLLYAC